MQMLKKPVHPSGTSSPSSASAMYSALYTVQTITLSKTFGKTFRHSDSEKNEKILIFLRDAFQNKMKAFRRKVSHTRKFFIR